MKVFKSMTALILALVMAAMLAVSAYAATVVVKYKVYVYTSQLTFKQYDYSSSATPSTRNLTILADSSLGSGSALYHLKYVNGTVAYCIQPGARSDDSSNYVQGSSGCWYNLPASVQSGIALALACGYPSAEYGSVYGDSNSSDIIDAEKWAATQAVIWDLICEYRSPYDYRSWETSPFYGCVDTSRYPTFAMWYSEIVDAMQSAADIPSFAATSSRWCDTIELTKDASGSYSASVTDGNGVLDDFNFASNSGNGITFSQRGNTLTITATAEAAKNLSTEKTCSATGSAYGIDPDEAVLCWYDSTGKYQSLASYTGTGLDPVRAYIKIKATVADEVGRLTINKVDADTGKVLAGVTYRLFDSAGNKIADVTTGADGKAVFSDLPLGSYTYQEISAPSGYVVDDNVPLVKEPIYCITGNAIDRKPENGGNGIGYQENVMYTLNTMDRHAVCCTSDVVGALCSGDEKGVDQYVDQGKCVMDLYTCEPAGDKDLPFLLIRRLTPLECERLQGFPDGWTDIPGASDSARYKALGNSVAIPCVDFVMKCMADTIRESEGEL